MDNFDIKQDTKKALQILRRDIIDMSEKTGHVAVALSCLDIIAVLYFDVLNVRPENVNSCDRDIFILSKGHGCMALYAVLYRAGFIDATTMKTYAENGSILAEHPLAGKLPSLEFAAGSLGHGLAVAAGMAKALKLQNRKQNVFVLLGDGECDEGSVWEASAIAVSQNLDNLTVIVDWNGLQASGKCAEISKGQYLPDCWKTFGWEIEHVDGHNYADLKTAFSKKQNSQQPRVVFCKTTKGKGIDFMENNLTWHYRPVTNNERDAAIERLGDA